MNTGFLDMFLSVDGTIGQYLPRMQGKQRMFVRVPAFVSLRLCKSLMNQRLTLILALGADQTKASFEPFDVMPSTPIKAILGNCILFVEREIGTRRNHNPLMNPALGGYLFLGLQCDRLDSHEGNWYSICTLVFAARKMA